MTTKSDPVSSERRLWRVRVVRYVSRTKKSKPMRTVFGVLLEAPDSDTAMADATAYGVNNAPFGQVLHSCEAREAATVELPLQVAP